MSAFEIRVMPNEYIVAKITVKGKSYHSAQADLRGLRVECFLFHLNETDPEGSASPR